MDSASIRNEILKLAKEYVQAREIEKKTRSYIPVSGKKIGEEELVNMIDASLDMWLTTGRYNDEFEKEFSRKLNIPFCLTTTSGSSANLLALTSLTSYKLKDRALKPGDEVISVAAGFPTTVNPIIQNNLIPVFVDCELDSYNIDINRIEESISSKTKAIFVAHTLGNMYSVEKILDLAKKYKLWVIEDSCDALGARWKGQMAGTFGDIGTFSFYPAHHITMGEGGAIVTKHEDLNKIIASFRDWGRDCWCKPGKDNTCGCRFCMKRGRLPSGYDHKYTYSHIGYNLKITDWQAAIGVAQLNKLEEFIEQRTANAEFLKKSLEDLSEELLLPKVDPACSPAWFGFLLSVRNPSRVNKNELVTFLENNGVGTRNLFAGNLLRQPMMVRNHIPLRIEDSELKYSDELNESDYSRLPNTEFVMNNSFWVGTAPCNDLSDMAVISEKIHEFFPSLKK